MSIFRDILTEAREEAPKLITGVLDWQLEHAAVMFLAHAKAATYYRREELLARTRRQKVRAAWFRLRAITHRRARERFRRLVEAQDTAQQCRGVLQCMEDSL